MLVLQSDVCCKQVSRGRGIAIRSFRQDKVTSITVSSITFKSKLF